MGITLTDKEVSILLGATLMHWGVPFRFAAKHELSDEQQVMLDGASDKLVALREARRQSSHDSQEVHLTEQEITLLTEVLNDCLHECGNDPIELNLQLRTRNKTDVESLLARLRDLRVSPQCSS